ncbi:MAG: hypothetical protein WDZ35_12425 [Crocinitomicaceae bacterium]
MKKFRLAFIIALLIALVVWAIYLAKQDDGTSKLSDEALSDFAIEDTASIDQIILSDTEGNEGVNLIRKDGQWRMESGDCVQQHLVHTMLKTIKLVQVKSPVPKNSLETINKNLTTHHRKVEIYQNGEWVKTWYVGQPTQDQYGTYMLLKDPEKGKSPEPFIMYLPSMYGNLETRFITNPLEFECTGVFNYNPRDIQSVQVQTPDSSENNFTITVLDDNMFKLTSNKTEIAGFDTMKVRNYLLGFKKIHFEQHNYLIDQHAADSLKKTTPWYIIEVTDVKGEKKHVKLYEKRMVYEKYDYNGELIVFDRDRLWVVLDDGRLVVGQFYVFDKLLHDVRYFIKNQAAG